ncbi:MAG: AAA-like domain-containing protein [Eubacteriales bacterium]|nr:AAA-like domain-containing protein [Eubacteriales bacterium]
MGKRFNVTGSCISEKHYMADTNEKIRQIIRLIEQDDYFTINRARQYGKTTSLLLVWKRLKDKYIVINTSFEGMGQDAFKSENAFVCRFCGRVKNSLRLSGYAEFLQKYWDVSEEENLDTLKQRISVFCEKAGKEVLLFVDEVDKSSDNQMFLNFLGVLRELYLERAMGGKTFKSVILAGVYDVKNLKLKLRPDEERKYNSPWNVAVDFQVDMSFSPGEIESMLREYEQDHRTNMDISLVAEEIYHYTSGYPYLVSLVCLYMDERLPEILKGRNCWNIEGVRLAVREILKSTNTLFDDVIKNIENFPSFGTFVEQILLAGNQIPYKISIKEINLGVTFGIIAEEDGLCKISNIIFETYIYDHFIAKRLVGQTDIQISRNQFVTSDGKLDMDLILEKFQELMKAEYRKSDDTFLERQGRLLFLCFLKPIINGTGHYVIEPQTRDNTRMDIVVFYGMYEYIIELKLWHGPKKQTDGLIQLSQYLESRSQKNGWLVSFCFGANKDRITDVYSGKHIEWDGKNIFEIVV